MTIYGGDLSHYNSVPDITNWAFGFNKCTQGASEVDPTYVSRHNYFRQQGKVFGAYHFMSMAVGASVQAQWFDDHASIQPGDLIALDFEDDGTWSQYNNATIAAMGRAILDVWRVIYPENRVLLYCNMNAYDNIVVPYGLLTHCDGLWIAHPGTMPNNGWIFWQYSTAGVDLDQAAVFSSEQELVNWSMKGSNDVNLTDKLDPNAAPGTVNEALNSVLFGIANVRNAGALALAVNNIETQVNTLVSNLNDVLSRLVTLETAVANQGKPTGTFTITGSGSVQ